MQRDNSTVTKEQGRHSDPSTSSLTPLRSDFLNGPAGWRSRSRSLSPRKRLVKQPLHIRMNLTETQMDKITDAFSYKVTGSPANPRQRDEMVTPKSSPKKKSSHRGSDRPHGWNVSDEDTSALDSPTFSELMPGRRQAEREDPFVSTLAGRRQKVPPPPIQTGSTRQYPHNPIPRRAEMEPVSDPVSPLSESRIDNTRYADADSASEYSQDLRYSNHPQPLDLGRHHHARSQSRVNNAVVASYRDWARETSHPTPYEASHRHAGLANRPRRSKSNAEGLRQAYVPSPEPPAMPQPQQRLALGNETPLFSPLQFYFRGQDYPTAKKGEKTMIGDNGWLERTEKLQDVTKKAPQKKTGILDSIKKIAKDMAELSHSTRRTGHTAKERPTSQINISLTGREQSLFYCELEFYLSHALNEYITVQLDKGRLVPDKLKKIADGWQNKGRPKVVGFRYDLETQLELVGMHIDDFRFYGRRQGDPVEIAGLLHAMKVNARAMSVRTFCQPDSVIAKQLVDAQSLFKMLGVPDIQQLALAEVAQFFKVIVEREQDRRELRKYETRKGKRVQVQGEVSWHE